MSPDSIDPQLRSFGSIARGSLGHADAIGYGSIEMGSRRSARTIRIHCANCGEFLYKYRKGGSGRLVKCFKDGIVQDNTEGDLRCPGCGQAFARETMVYGRPANKIIQGKVTVRR